MINLAWVDGNSFYLGVITGLIFGLLIVLFVGGVLLRNVISES